MPPKSSAGALPSRSAQTPKAVRPPGASTKPGSSASKGGAAKGSAAKGSLSPAARSPMPGSPAEKRLLLVEKQKAKEEEARKAAEEVEKAQKEAVARAKEEKARCKLHDHIRSSHCAHANAATSLLADSVLVNPREPLIWTCKKPCELLTVTYPFQRERLANSHAEQIQERRKQELQMQHQRNTLRAAENARKRLAREEKEKGAAWPYKMRLHAAAMGGDLEVAEVFLREDTDDAFNVSRIDPNVKWREDGQSPIFLATVRGQLDMMRRLIAAKADVNITNNDGRTPLSLGAEFGQTPAMSILVDAGADINARDNRGRTALHVSVGFNRVETTRQLLIWKVT